MEGEEEKKSGLEALVLKFARAKGIPEEEARKIYLPVLMMSFGQKREDAVGRLAPMAEGLAALASATKDMNPEAAKYLQLLAGTQIQKALNTPSEDDPDVGDAIKRVVPQIAALKAIDKAFEAAYPKEERVNPDVKALTDAVNQLVVTVSELMKNQQSQGENLAEKALNEIASLKELLAKERETKEKSILLEKIEALEAQLATLRSTPPGSNVDMELERMRMEHERWKAEHEWEIERWKMEQGLSSKRDRERMKMLMDLFKPFTQKVSPLVDAAVQAGERKVRSIGGGMAGAASAVGSLAAGAEEFFTCIKCGNPIQVKGFPETLTCEKCGMVYKRQM